MQRWMILVLAGVLTAAVAFVALKSRPTTPAAPVTSAAPPSSASAAQTAPAVEPPKDEGSLGDFPDTDEARRPAVPLPENAPKEVGFGVVLFTYAGAEFAPKTARSKAQALDLAKQAVPFAQQNFQEAVKRGDPGSTDDAGHIPRGVLEPHVEYALFTLEKSAVYGEPLDTPRGYWIVRRRD
jgi:hypothetical protein